MASGGSVVGIKFRDGASTGAMIASDTLLNYGSLAKLPHIPRTRIVSPNAAICASGDYADFQAATDDLESEVRFAALTGISVAPSEVFSMLQRSVYSHRNQFSPRLCSFVVIGHSGGADGAFLGAMDSIGTRWTDDCVGTGYGGHIALPLMRRALDRVRLASGDEAALPTREQARAIVEDCLRALFYRECRTINRFQITEAAEGKVVIGEPFSVETQWEFDGFRFEKTSIIQ
mgnify:CR=1 FL=1